IVIILAKASMWKLVCSPPPSQEWSTRRPPMLLAASTRPVWAMPILACSLTNHYQQQIWTLLSQLETIGSSASSVRSSIFLSYRMIQDLHTPRIAPATVKLYARCWLNDSAQKQPTNGFAC